MEHLPTAAEQPQLLIGSTTGMPRRDVAIQPQDLLHHTAILGSTGSGKSTLAMNIVEQILLIGVPVIVVDRKGDLTRYAFPDAFGPPPTELTISDPAIGDQRRLLQERVDVALWTPNLRGARNLAIRLLPDAVDELDDHERDQAVEQAADGLAGMLGLRQTDKHKAYRAILRVALDHLGGLGGPVTLERLSALLQGPELRGKTGALEKSQKGLVQLVVTLQLSSKTLFGNGPRLNIDELLGRGDFGRPNRTRLSIINTHFLGDQQLFWVAQLLSELWRWTVKNPCDRLQAVVVLDEADHYLPATSKPATKGPVENLLRRARSAGVGLMLATQNPGDLDYKCRDNVRSWFVGRLKEPRTIDKIKPHLPDVEIDGASRLTAGQFLREGETSAFQARRCVVSLSQVPDEETRRLAQEASSSTTKPLDIPQQEPCPHCRQSSVPFRALGNGAMECPRCTGRFTSPDAAGENRTARGGPSGWHGQQGTTRAHPCPHCGQSVVPFRALSDGSKVCLSCSRSHNG